LKFWFGEEGGERAKASQTYNGFLLCTRFAKGEQLWDTKAEGTSRDGSQLGPSEGTALGVGIRERVRGACCCGARGGQPHAYWNATCQGIYCKCLSLWGSDSSLDTLVAFNRRPSDKTSSLHLTQLNFGSLARGKLLSLTGPESAGKEVWWRIHPPTFLVQSRRCFYLV
jgi:hypothetical protein